jgi:anthranilate/para-aminobenzoate synthase component I
MSIHSYSSTQILIQLHTYILCCASMHTGVVTPSGISVGAGGAVIALSDVQDEYAEMLLKSSAVLQALVGTHISVDTTATETTAAATTTAAAAAVK